MVELVPDVVVPTQIVLVCLHDVDHHLGILLLLVLGYAIVGQHPLPVFGKSLY